MREQAISMLLFRAYIYDNLVVGVICVIFIVDVEEYFVRFDFIKVELGGIEWLI